MRTLLAFFKLGSVLAVVSITAGCGKSGGAVLYCEHGEENPSWTWSSIRLEDTMHIDLERSLIYGGDVSSTVSPLVDGHLAGFESSFPLLLFSGSVDPSEIPDSVEIEDILFRFSLVETDPGDLWLITAKPKVPRSEHAWRQRSTVLYSTADGVLLISLSASIGEKIYPINLVPCGNETLKFDDLRRFADSAGP